MTALVCQVSIKTGVIRLSKVMVGTWKLVYKANPVLTGDFGSVRLPKLVAKILEHEKHQVLTRYRVAIAFRIASRV